MNLNLPDLPDLDGKKTQREVEKIFGKYVLYKYILIPERREVTMTASYVLREGTSGGMTSDQTGSVASYNADKSSEADWYCTRIERLVSRLPGREKMLVQSRYMQNAERVTDLDVYSGVLECSDKTYSMIRSRALYKLVIMLDELGMVDLESLLKQR